MRSAGASVDVVLPRDLARCGRAGAGIPSRRQRELGWSLPAQGEGFRFFGGA